MPTPPASISGNVASSRISSSLAMVGHSLDARAMAVAAQTLGTKPDGPRIEAAHLLGAAIGAHGDWTTLTAHVDPALHGLRTGSRWTDEHDLRARPAPADHRPVELGIAHHLSVKSCVFGEQAVSTDDRSRNDPLVVV